jgi:hypothetical protein
MTSKKARKKMEQRLLKLMQNPRCTAIYTVGYGRSSAFVRYRCIVRDEKRPHLWQSYYYFVVGFRGPLSIKISCFCREGFASRVVGLGKIRSITPAKLAREAAFHSSAEDKTEVVGWF